jgi:hypothetical protein
MKIEIEIGEKTHELITGLSDFIGKAKEALEDGFQPGSDVPEMAISALTDLAPALMNASDLKDEFDSNPDSRAIAAALLANEVMSIFK